MSYIIWQTTQTSYTTLDAIIAPKAHRTKSQRNVSFTKLKSNRTLTIKRGGLSKIKAHTAKWAARLNAAAYYTAYGLKQKL